MKKFTITTKREGEGAARSEHDFRDEKSAVEDAQVALAEMARDALPDGSHVGLSATVEDDTGTVVYQASLNFDAQTGEEIKNTETEAIEAAETVAAVLRGDVTK